jgi:hypothetical protein
MTTTSPQSPRRVSGTPRAASAATPRAGRGSPLSNKQKQILSIEAAAAFARLDKVGGIHLPAEVERSATSQRQTFWRHQQTAEVTGFDSFTKLTQSHYLPLLAHFQKLSGKSGPAFDNALKNEQGSTMDREPGCAWVRDMMHLASKAGLSTNYILTIQRSKFGRAETRDLTEAQLKQLCDTVINRARQKLGLGSPENRNKKQREQRQQKPTAGVQDEAEPF